jgi:hypothetical protein
VFKLDGELEDIAADGIGDFDFSGRVGEFADVARGLEVVEKGRGEHGKSIAACAAGCRGKGESLQFTVDSFGGRENLTQRRRGSRGSQRKRNPRAKSAVSMLAGT